MIFNNSEEYPRSYFFYYVSFFTSGLRNINQMIPSKRIRPNPFILLTRSNNTGISSNTHIATVIACTILFLKIEKFSILYILRKMFRLTDTL